MIRSWTFILLTAICAGAELRDPDPIAWITEQGGRAERNDAGQIVAVDLTSTWITDADLARIGRIGSLRKLNLAHTRITDVGIEHLKPLKNVTELSLYYA